MVIPGISIGCFAYYLFHFLQFYVCKDFIQYYLFILVLEFYQDIRSCLISGDFFLVFDELHKAKSKYIVFPFVDVLQYYFNCFHFSCVNGTSSGRASLLLISVTTATKPTFIPVLFNQSVQASLAFLCFFLCCKKCYFSCCHYQ